MKKIWNKLSMLMLKIFYVVCCMLVIGSIGTFIGMLLSEMFSTKVFFFFGIIIGAFIGLIQGIRERIHVPGGPGGGSG